MTKSSCVAIKLLPDLLICSNSAQRGRIYLPQDELAQFGISEEDVFSRRVTDRWRRFMKEQIARARFYFNQAEEGASQLTEASRWPVSTMLSLHLSCAITFMHALVVCIEIFFLSRL